MKTFLILVSVMVVIFIAEPNKVIAQNLAVKKQIVSKLDLTKAEIKECGGVNKIVHALENVDLNKDRKPEIIAYFNCSPFVGFFVLLKKTDDVEILYEGGEREGITALKTYTKGWRNLRSDMWSAGSGESGSVILRWNGSKYKGQ